MGFVSNGDAKKEKFDFVEKIYNRILVFGSDGKEEKDTAIEGNEDKLRKKLEPGSLLEVKKKKFLKELEVVLMAEDKTKAEKVMGNTKQTHLTHQANPPNSTPDPVPPQPTAHHTDPTTIHHQNSAPNPRPKPISKPITTHNQIRFANPQPRRSRRHNNYQILDHANLT